MVKGGIVQGMNTEQVRSGEMVLTGEQAAEAMNVNFLRLNPEDPHTCEHCMNHYIDIDEMTDREMHKCHQYEKTGQYIINRCQTHYVNDCELWESPFISDYRPDLKKELKK